MIPTTSSARELYMQLWSKEQWDSMEADFLLLESQQKLHNLQNILKHRLE
jgi:hypothetical protein